MQELGHEPAIDPPIVEKLSWGFERYAYELMNDYFNAGKYVDQTILCANDRLAFGVIDFLRGVFNLRSIRSNARSIF